MGSLSLADTRVRLTGSYYTPHSTAEFMANWAVRSHDETILEPSFGDGAFIEAVAVAARAKGLDGLTVHGVELSEACHRRVGSTDWGVELELTRADFHTTEPFTVDAVIGNPPYVRFRHLEEPADCQVALRAGRTVLGSSLDPSGSVWMSFVLHATRSLKTGGRLALVLPYDMTYVRYARPLWAFLQNNFGAMAVHRVRERLFPDILQEAIILFADQFGRSTDGIHFTAYESVDDLVEGRPESTARIDIVDVTSGRRPFPEALLDADLRNLLREQVDGRVAPAQSMMTFNIGYVTGDKKFFHPDRQTVDTFELPDHSLHATLTSSRRLKGVGLNTSSIADPDFLYLPPEGGRAVLTPAEADYVRFGEDLKVHERYKCRIRDPWFRVPYVKTPDVVVSVFSSTPLLAINDGGLFASNSLLCGYTNRDHDTADIAARWYSSLTLLECELRVHSLGGGVLIMVPGEVNSIRLPEKAPGVDLDLVDAHLRSGDLRSAYEAGDKPALEAGLGLAPEQVRMLRDGVDRLRTWRERSATSTGHVAQHVFEWRRGESNP